MKKIITLLLTATMLVCTSCGDKISDSDSSVKDSSGSASAAENSEPENSTDKSEEETAEENFWDFYGLNVLEPANLEKYGFSGELMWGRGSEATEKLYFS